MAVFKCKMCGGDLEVTDTKSVIECDYCGTSQTIPAADDEKKVNLFNRANRLRFKNEFDKAEAIYESIVSEFPEEPEAYWGICLCKYGIEYVDDPATAKKIPTCHRTSFRSIFDEENYKLALEYADVVAQKIYRDEARAIDTLQKDILAVVNSVEPYDVFICYKETGEDGQRTHDSVLAQDIYDELTEKGLKVFFARITLEDKLGSAYEPYIFAALNSAKVMLVVGTKYEHFNAVWVKNEWSRYLEFMKADRKRTLIPCYKDMDAYDMPDEFSNLQAQDMNKIGAMQDLVRGVLKIAKPVTETPAQNVVQQTVVQTTVSSNVANLLKRGYMSLEEWRWKEADSFFERVLDEDAECGSAYLGKMLANEKCGSVDDCIRKIENIELYMQSLRSKESLDKAIASGVCRSPATWLDMVSNIKKVDLDNNTLFKNALKYCDGTDKEALDKMLAVRDEAEKAYNELKKRMDQLEFIYVDDKHVKRTNIIKVFCYESQGEEARKRLSGSTYVALSIDNDIWTLERFADRNNACIKKLIIAEGIQIIGDKAFYYVHFYGDEIVIPSTVRKIGKEAFKGCFNLTSITIPESVTEIGDNAFAGCEKLSKVIIPQKYISEPTAQRLGLPLHVLVSQKMLEEEAERQRQQEKERQERLAREREELRQKLEQQRKEEAQMAEYRSQGVCQHCGGTFKGLFSKTCSSCGMKKDY